MVRRTRRRFPINSVNDGSLFNSLLFLLLLITVLPAYAGEAESGATGNAYMILPFAILLLSIAIIPLLNRRWWEKYYPAVSVGLGATTLIYYLFVLNDAQRIVRSGMEYLSFIILIGSLFVVAGGVYIRIKGKSTPITNLALLAIGAVIANVIGTTGASLILIRPYLQVNKYRFRGYHLVFFIFIVSNIGGALTPIGDPPLFLGYLKGVPFYWVVENAWYIWGIVVGILLLLFFAIDTISFRKFEATAKGIADEELHEEATVRGLHNLFFLAVIVLAVFIEHPVFLREVLMLIAAGGSYMMTGKEIHARNSFSFGPVKEVAILFLGIFLTMVPALDWLEMHASQIGIVTQGHFYWGTGILSSVLDNAPTYLAFLSAGIGLFVDQNVIGQVQHLVATHGSDLANVGGVHAVEIRNTFVTLTRLHPDLVATGTVPINDIKTCYLISNHAIYLKAISLGAVFFGAMTYIGNGPNFIVKSIAEQVGVKCPGFVSYIFRYSLPILLPVFVLVWWVFFR